MTTEVRDVPASSRFEIWVDEQRAGYLNYTIDGGIAALPATKIDPSYEGRGLGTTLVVGALEALRRRELQVLPICPFIPAVMRKHPEFIALVPEAERARFGLEA